MQIILASGSPRRRELLARLVPSFTVLVRETDESLPPETSPADGVVLLAKRKGEAVLPLAGEEALILSSDTLVELDGARLGKPADPADAVRMLMALSGRTHFVRTGVAVHYRGIERQGLATAAVTFRPLTAEEIHAYVQTGEPMDKAGAYGIQGLGGALVASYEGDFDTIMGLSLRLTRSLMAEIAAVFGEQVTFLSE